MSDVSSTVSESHRRSVQRKQITDKDSQFLGVLNVRLFEIHMEKTKRSVVNDQRDCTVLPLQVMQLQH